MAPKRKAKSRAGSPEQQPSRQFVVLTGLSGSGKSTVLKAFEDLGFYCVDNLPVDLIPHFSDLFLEAGNGFERTALLVDVREGSKLKGFPAVFRQLRRDHPATLVFIEADDEALLRRFSETRRPHPMGRDLAPREAIRRERRLLEPIRRLADLVIDTTSFNVHELRGFINERFQDPDQRPMLISLMSFGFRFGVPSDADLVFDVRFLPNPHFKPKLRHLTGQHPRVARYVRSFPQTIEFLRRIQSLLTFLIPHYIKEGKSYLTIAFGCTGGRHRSVMMAESLGRTLSKKGLATKVVHRDIGR